MLKRFGKKKKAIPTELSWEEKNPINYLYKPNKAILWLRQSVKRKGVKYVKTLH